MNYLENLDIFVEVHKCIGEMASIFQSEEKKKKKKKDYNYEGSGSEFEDDSDGEPGAPGTESKMIQSSSVIRK